MPAYHQKATFYRAALLLGLVPGETVVAWADGVIERDPAVPPALLAVTLTAPGDLTALRNALQPIADEDDSPAVVRAVFDTARRDLESGRRDAGDTVTVLAQVRRFLTVTTVVVDELDGFQGDYMLAAAGVIGDVATMERRLRAWLAQFAGAEPALMAEPAYHEIVFDRPAEAAAFVAALSRFLASPSSTAATTRTNPAEVWSVSSATRNDVTLYLSQAARDAADAAFPPVPVVRTLAADDRPREAVLVLDGLALRAMGLEEAQRCLAAGSS